MPARSLVQQAVLLEAMVVRCCQDWYERLGKVDRALLTGHNKARKKERIKRKSITIFFAFATFPTKSS